jgi:hypothetical protein
MRTCKNCKEKFEQIRSNQIVCSASCAYEYSKTKNQKKEKKEWNQRKKVIKEKLKTRSEHLKDLQNIFNKYIRERDKKKPCISCLKPLQEKFDAGHYRSVGSCPELRFNELNVHGQCVHCNQHLHGNLINYRKNLIKRIGEDNLLLLENHVLPLKLTIPEIKEMKLKYKQKIKELK